MFDCHSIPLEVLMTLLPLLLTREGEYAYDACYDSTKMNTQGIKQQYLSPSTFRITAGNR